MLRARQVLLSGLAVIALAGSVAVAADILSQFRLTEEDAQTSVFETIWRGAPDGSGSAPSIFRALSPDARATAVAAAATFVRAYCESDAFRERYAAMRQAERPPDVPATTLANVDVDKQAAQTKKALDETRAALANMPPEVRKMMEAAMQEAGQRHHEHRRAARAGGEGRGGHVQKQKAAQAKASTAIAARQQSAKEFDETYPANPETFIARRLRDVPRFVGDGACRRGAGTPRQQDGVRRSGARATAGVVEAALSRGQAVGRCGTRRGDRVARGP